MNKSESITALAAALTKAQAQMSGAKKSAANPKHCLSIRLVWFGLS